MSLGENVRRLRNAKGWTQADLAEHTGLRVNHISKIEQNEGDPKASTLYKLIRAFGCTATGLMTDLNPGNEYTSADALLELIWERVEKLPIEAKEEMVRFLDRYCMGWEMELAVKQSPRRWAEGFRPRPVKERKEQDEQPASSKPSE